MNYLVAIGAFLVLAALSLPISTFIYFLSGRRVEFASIFFAMVASMGFASIFSIIALVVCIAIYQDKEIYLTGSIVGGIFVGFTTVLSFFYVRGALAMAPEDPVGEPDNGWTNDNEGEWDESK